MKDGNANGNESDKLGSVGQESNTPPNAWAMNANSAALTGINTGNIIIDEDLFTTPKPHAASLSLTDNLAFSLDSVDSLVAPTRQPFYLDPPYSEDVPFTLDALLSSEVSSRKDLSVQQLAFPSRQPKERHMARPAIPYMGSRPELLTSPEVHFNRDEIFSLDGMLMRHEGLGEPFSEMFNMEM
jgi:hypothetical protein